MFPVLLMVTFLILFFSLYIAQGAIVYYEASTASERAAFAWSNSNKDPRTGAYPEGQYEGLYWRLTEDRLISGLFGGTTTAEDEEGVSIENEASTEAGGGLTERKLSAAANSLKASIPGEWGYRNTAVFREIAGEASSSAVPEALRRIWPAAAIRSVPTSVVVEPAEFIRTVDLIRYYAQKFRGAEEGEEAYRSKAQAVLQSKLSS